MPGDAKLSLPGFPFACVINPLRFAANDFLFPTSRASARGAAESRVPRLHDGLGAAVHPELAQNSRDLVSHRLFAGAKTAGNRLIAETFRDGVENLSFARGQFAKREIRGRGLLGQKLIERRRELQPRRLAVEQDVISRLERNEARTGNEAREQTPLLERDQSVKPSVANQGRTVYAAYDIVDVSLPIAAQQLERGRRRRRQPQ